MRFEGFLLQNYHIGIRGCGGGTGGEETWGHGVGWGGGVGGPGGLWSGGLVWGWAGRVLGWDGWGPVVVVRGLFVSIFVSWPLDVRPTKREETEELVKMMIKRRTGLMFLSMEH